MHFSGMVKTVGVAALLIAAGVSAKSFPSKPFRVVVPFTAGSATDILARLIGPRMLEHWDEQVIVDNRPSAAGVIAGEIVAKAAPDGYTPSRTPRTIINTLSREVARIMALAEVKQRIVSLGAVPKSSTPAEFDNLVHSEITKRAEVFGRVTVKLN